MKFHVSLHGRGDKTGQIYQQVKAAVLDGRLRVGDPLPPTRELARLLDVSRNTVSAAYDRLTAEGFVSARVGAGTFVKAGGFAEPARPPGGGTLRPRAVWNGISAYRADRSTREFDFRAGIPDAELFPYAAWRRLLSRQFTRSGIGSLMYGDPAGHEGLRAAIARHIGVSRAVRATGDDVLVTNGAQQALDLVGRVLVEPGTVVAVEAPGYVPPRELFTSLGATVVGVPVDAEGIRVDMLPADARLVYVTPSHQFPLGMPMSLARRTALLAWAERTGAVLVEDDYDSEFRFSGRPIEPLQNLDRSGRVVYVGSLSKVLLPTLRLGFLIAPPDLRDALLAAKYVTDWHSQLPIQGVLAGFIDEGLLARHIRRCRAAYQERYTRIRAVLDRDFTDVLEPVPSVAGMHLSSYLRGDDLALFHRAKAAGVGLFVLSHFRFPGVESRPGVVLGYGAIPLSKVDEGLRRLRACL